MKLTKVFLITAFAVASLLFTERTMADVEPPKNEVKQIVISRVNIHDAKIVSQEGNTLTISFNLNNREGEQSGMKYGVILTKKIEGKESLVDEFVYPEVVNLVANESLIKEIRYDAPAGIKEGSYEVKISSRNFGGLLIGTQKLGEVSFSKEDISLEILPESCSVSIKEGKQTSKTEDNVPDGKKRTGINITKDDQIILSCVAKNNSNEDVSVESSFKTFKKNLYGEEVPQQGGDMSPILLRPLEEKMVNLTLPKILVPQSYVTKVSIASTNFKSNSILVSYTVSGLSATVQNVSLDKNSYKANETAKLSFFWTSSATNREELTSISLTADIVNKNKKPCIDNTLNTQMARVGFIEIPVTMNRSCEGPEVTVSLLDATGKVLDQKALVFEASEKSNIFTGKTGIIAIVILGLIMLAGIIMYFKKSKKDNNKDDGTSTSKSGHIEGAMLTIFFAILVSLVPGGVVKADIVYMDPSGECSEGSCYYEYIAISVYMDKSTYSAGEEVTVYTEMSEKEPWWSNSSYYLWAKVGGYRQKIAEGIQETGTLESAYFTAPSSGGSYNLEYDGYANSFSGGSGSLYYSGYIPYQVENATPPPPPTITVYAKNVSTGVTSTGYIVVGAGSQVQITWTATNTQGRQLLCDPGCGNSWGDVYNHWGGSYLYPSTTTKYSVYTVAQY